MRCKGYYALVNATMFNTSTTATTSANGTFTFGNSYNTQYTLDSGKFLIRVGKGTEEAKITDIALNEYFPDNTVSYSTLIAAKNINSETGALACTFSAAITNVSNDAIQIKEAGLFYRSSSSSSTLVLLVRQVLEEPIELFPNETTYLRARLF